MKTSENLPVNKDLDIAVIGMSGRFPGAKNIDKFWHNLRDGVESISFFSEAELESSGIDPAILHHPNYIKAAPMLDDIDLFDASFFGYNSREAEMLDPQNRIFMECAWSALENAGYNPKNYSGSIGVYAGKTLSMYLLNNLHQNIKFGGHIINSVNLKTIIGSERDFLSTGVSYKLNLKGPSFNVQTACSSSLVAIHLARQSLLMGECDMALAGGVSIYVLQKSGYLYEEGMILSDDGHCRAFDAKAKGTIFGNGVGIVVLKPLVKALADGDCIHAVIKGSALNNDGASKIGYTAPSVFGQAEVITEAIANSGVEAETLGYVETHGTGTPQGDPIEIAGLTQAFSNFTQKKGFCAIGSVKTNIGHLDVAAGVTGFIKTVLMLKHKTLVKSLHFDRPNPQIDFANSPFYVNTSLSDWKTDGTPRRAGVSAFGIGGTNAHVILEEAPQLVSVKPEIDRPLHLLNLSAKSEKALKELAQSYETHLASHSSESLADICFTANVGRSHFDHRLALVADSAELFRQQLAAFLNGKEPDGVCVGQKVSSQPKVAFLFTGQGSQYIDMGRELYSTEPTFRQALERCDELLRPYLDVPLLEVLYPEAGVSSPLDRTSYSQPTLFALEYALAQLWLSWGIKPDAVMGHSLGEYVAACVAGVFSIEDGLKLVVERGRLMEALPPDGEMVAVFANEECVREALAPYRSEIAIAAINSPTETVISGKSSTVEAVLEDLKQYGLQTRRLRVSHAFHSPLMEPMLSAFRATAAKVTYSSPQIPLVSNLTGLFVQAEEISSPDYWCRHIRETVRFSDAIKTLKRSGIELFVEIGPQPILSGLGRRCIPEYPGVWLPSLRKERSDWQQMLSSLGTLYVRGVEVNWANFERNYPRRRLELPTYPFQRQRYWIEAPVRMPVGMQAEKTPEFLSDSLPSKRDILPDIVIPAAKNEVLKNLVFSGVSLDNSSSLESYLCQKIGWLLGLNVSDLDEQKSLRNLGFDSLTLIELQTHIETDLGVNLPVEDLISGPSIIQLAHNLRQLQTPSKFIAFNALDELSQLNSSLLKWAELTVRSSSVNTSWITNTSLNPHANKRLFCFPYAGGGASIFQTWANDLPKEIEVCPVQLPGRENRLSELPFEDLTLLVETLAEVLLPVLDKPFAFYGHSMGALVAFELTRYLKKRFDLSPIHLFVAAYTAPQLPNPFRPLDDSSSLASIEILRDLGVPSLVLEKPELLQVFLPTFKADSKVFHGYKYSKAEPLNCPISAFGGTLDTLVSFEAIAAWREHTRSTFNLQLFPGNHLFLKSERELLLRKISQELMQYSLPEAAQRQFDSFTPAFVS